MREGKVEPSAYPRAPLDVLAQQIVAIATMDEIHVDALYDLVRQAAPWAELARASFDGVLDMLPAAIPRTSSRARPEDDLDDEDPCEDDPVRA